MDKKESCPQARASFIISTARSGSTLLRYILNSHPAISCPGELYLGQLCRDLYLTINHTKGQVAAGSDKAKRELIVLAEVRRIVCELMDSYARARNALMWCEKTPTNVDHLRILARVFPEAKYICLYRNCLDVVYSLIEANTHGWYPDLVQYVHRRPENLISAMIESWIDKTNRMVEFELANPANCFRLKYESLVLDPPDTLKPLFEFLCLEWDPLVLSKVFSTQHDPGPGDIKIRFSRRINESSIGKGSRLPLRAIPEDLLEKMNNLLVKLDYAVIGPDWDFTPSPYRAEPADGRDEHVEEVEQVFTNHIPQRIRAQKESLEGIKGKCKFIIPELGSRAWMIDLTGEAGHLVSGDSAADFTITISADDLTDIVSGRSNAGEAFLQGKLKVGGDLTLANAVCQVFFQEDLNTKGLVRKMTGGLST
jgi:protein-tyrosine sulfotransferase